MATASDNIVVIADAEAIRTEEVEKQLRSFNYVAVDTEYAGSKLSLLQISTPEKTVFLLDVKRLEKIIDPFKKILTSSDIVKVMHDCKGDSQNLWQEKYDCIKMENVFDTQLIHQILKSRENNRPIRYEQPGLKTLCKEYEVPMDNDLKDRVKRSLQQDNAYFWTRNSDGSIPDEMKKYAAQDVIVLIDLYKKMESLLGQDMKPLYNRLVAVSLHADLKGVDNRTFYRRNKPLLGEVATPQLLAEFDAVPNKETGKESFKRSNGRKGRRN